MNVNVVKLVNGEEIIGDVTDGETSVSIKEPMLIGVESQRLIFVPYMQYTEAGKEITLDKRHVLLVVPPVESLIDEYYRATGKPRIVTPQKNIISSVR